MTDKQTLLGYRLKQAEETLSDAEKMYREDCSTRSITNRAYYSMFYAILALFLHSDIKIKTSKHSGIISVFDREFIHAGKMDKYFSKILHKMFTVRQEGDYKEHVEITAEDATRFIKLAKDFLNNIKEFMGKNFK